MKIFVKTLKGTSFEIEVNPTDTITDVKKAIETNNAELYPAPQQMLIHQGKILKDKTTLEENSVLENSFIVIMMSKPKVSSSGASTAPAPAPTVAATQAQPAQTVATPQVSAPTVSVPQPTSATATDAAPAAAAALKERFMVKQPQTLLLELTWSPLFSKFLTWVEVAGTVTLLSDP